MRTLSRPVATRTAPACTPDDRTRLRSTAPAPVPRAIRLLRAHESETSDGTPVILGRAPIRRTNPPVAGRQGSRTQQRLILASAFHSARPPSIRHQLPCLPSRAHASHLGDRKSLPPTTSMRHQQLRAGMHIHQPQPHHPPTLRTRPRFSNARSPRPARACERGFQRAGREPCTLFRGSRRTHGRGAQPGPSIPPSAPCGWHLRASRPSVPGNPRTQKPTSPASSPSHTRAACTAAGDMDMPWRRTRLGEARASACIIDISRKPRLHPIIRIPSPSLDGDEREGCVGPARACEMHGARRAGGTASAPCSPNRPPALPYASP